MSRSSTFVIVGGGLAGAKAAEALRDDDFDGQIILVAEEDRLPYERPPLSKEFLAGEKSLADFTVHAADWYRDHDVDLRLGARVSSLDAAAHTAVFTDGSAARYDKLLLATGCRSRRLPVPGSGAAGVHYLRTFDDAVALKQALQGGSSLAVIGAGWIGLEVAASARAHGVDVTVVDSAPLPLLATLGREAAEIFAKLHCDHGVDLRLNATVGEIVADRDAATGLRLGDGSADAVLVAVGASPNIELAEQAGLVTGGGGVLVDSSLCSSDRDIFAVGDIAA